MIDKVKKKKKSLKDGRKKRRGIKNKKRYRWSLTLSMEEGGGGVKF